MDKRIQAYSKIVTTTTPWISERLNLRGEQCVISEDDSEDEVECDAQVQAMSETMGKARALARDGADMSSAAMVKQFRTLRR